MTFFISCKQLFVLYGNIDLMCYECQFQMKTLLYVFCSSEKYSGSYWLSHNALPPTTSPLTSLIRQSMQESRYDYYKSAKYYQPFFMKEKQNISRLHKIICSLVSLFFYHILWKLWQPAKFMQCLITSVLVSYKLISYLKENKKFNKLSIRYREQQNAPSYFLVRMYITPVAYDQVIELSHQEYFSSRCSFWRNILTSFNWFWYQYEVYRLR